MGSPLNGQSNHLDHSCGEISILANQIYDQCKQTWCTSAGPWVSAEKCECILLEMPEDSDQFGRYLIPGQPVTLPECVKKIKLEDDSFFIEELCAAILRPVDSSRSCWEVEVRATFTCDVQFYSESMRRFPIRFLCKPDKGMEDSHVKPSLHTAFTLKKRILMHGGKDTVTSAGLPDRHECSTGPHVFVKLKADPIEFRSVQPQDIPDCTEVCDGNYEDPVNYLYAAIGLAMMLFLYQIISIRIPSSGISIPEDCAYGSLTPCEQFFKMDFPEKWNLKT